MIKQNKQWEEIFEMKISKHREGLKEFDKSKH